MERARSTVDCFTRYLGVDLKNIYVAAASGGNLMKFGLPISMNGKMSKYYLSLKYYPD